MINTDPSSTQPSLGQLVSQHHRRSLHERLNWAVILISVVVALVCGWMALQRGYDAYQHFGPAQVGRWTQRWLVGFIAAAGIAGLAIRSLLRWNQFSLRAYHQGLYIQTYETASTIRWEDIRGVAASGVQYGLLGLVWGKNTYLALETDQNQRVEIPPSLNNLEALAETIKQRVYPLLVERYKEQHAAGQSLQFGGILLTPSGITTPRATLAWENLTGITLHNGLITLESNESGGSQHLRLPTRNVPNIELLIQFIRRIGKLA